MDTSKMISSLREVISFLEKFDDKSKATENLSVDSPEKSEFEQLKEILDTKEWPLAVPSSMICDQVLEADKIERAEVINEIFINRSIEGMNFLDFGCGEGHVTKQLKEAGGAKLSVGHDIAKSGKMDWEVLEEGMLLTQDLETVESYGPYDIVMAYDVLDHCKGDPVELLRIMKSLVAPGGTLLIRFHPWCGRHGDHLYQTINKAFAHLVFTPEELSELGVEKTVTNKVTHPIGVYREYLNKAGMDDYKENVERSPVESFFQESPIVKKRISELWKDSPIESLKNQTEFPSHQMEQCFVDYEIKL